MGITLTSERIVIDRIKTDRPFNEDIVRQLIPSIAAIGLLQPIILQRPGTALGVKLVFGASRLEAMRRLGENAILSRVINGDTPEIRAWITDAQFAENMIRAKHFDYAAEKVVSLRSVRQSRS